MLTEDQFSFLANHSTVLQLLSCNFDWVNSINPHSVSADVIYIDYTKTFNSVVHKKLLFKLQKMLMYK